MNGSLEFRSLQLLQRHSKEADRDFRNSLPVESALLKGLRVGYFIQHAETEEIFLVDKAGNTWPMTEVRFLTSRLNAYEGSVELPRPFVIDQHLEILTDQIIGTPAADDREGEILAEGDYLLLGFLEDNPLNPIVFGSFRRLTDLSEVSTHSFFEQFSPETRDNAYHRRENTNYVLEMKREGTGKTMYTHRMKANADEDLQIMYEFYNKAEKKVTISITEDTLQILDERNQTLLNSEHIELGRKDASSEPAVLGAQLKAFLDGLLDLHGLHSHAPGSPPAQSAQYQAKKQDLVKLLSDIVFLDEKHQTAGA